MSMLPLGFSLGRASLSSVECGHFSFLGPAYRILEKQNHPKKNLTNLLRVLLFKDSSQAAPQTRRILHDASRHAISGLVAEQP